jgi:D-alanine-D-alanine ligase
MRGFLTMCELGDTGEDMSGSQQRIGVLVDGLSRPREFAFKSGEAIVNALTELGHDARPVFVDRDLDLALRQGRYDVAFLATRGRYSADGCVQGLLEMLGIPYTGSGVFASALAMNRAKSKEVLRLATLPTAPAYVLRSGGRQSILQHHGAFGFPVVVSPADAGLAVGSSLAKDELELEAGVEDAFRYGDEVLVERFVDGRVLVVGILDGTPVGIMDMGPVENRLGAAPEGPVEREGRPRLRYQAARQRSLMRLGEMAAETIGVEGPALIEMVVSERFNEVVVGVEAAPMLTPSSPYARLAAAAGLEFVDLIEEILRGARLRAHGCRRERRAARLAFDGPERRSSLLALPH